MADRLQIYNHALRHLGERRLATISEDREPRYHLDDAYPATEKFCLEQGDWNFATRTVRLAESNAIATQFGSTVAHRKPDDWVRTVSLSYSELDGYGGAANVSDERNVWITRPGPLYVRYVSNDPQWGRSLGDWPETFARYVAAQLAFDVAEHIRPGIDRIQLLGDLVKRALFDAQNKDATDEGARVRPVGRLTMSRGGWGYGYGRYGGRW